MSLMMEKEVWKYFEESDFKGYTVLIPSVAVGNVGQLCCDLLISSYNMKRLISIYSPAVIPVLGYDPYDIKSMNVSSSCEIYASEEKKLIIIQLRAPIIYKYAQKFFDHMIEHLKEKGIRDIIVLSSSYAYENKNVSTSTFRYVSSKNCPHKDIINKLQWVEHENKSDDLKIFGSGFAVYLYNMCLKSHVPCMILYKYSSEGDNIPDAYEMFNYLNKIMLLEIDEKNISLVHPVSWKLLFGCPPPKDIY